MLIIGCDFHTRYQQIAMAREETSELLVERRLDHQSGEAQAFYRSLQSSQEPVRVGIEATGPIHWFERFARGAWSRTVDRGDSAKIRASEVRKQKTDERDARLILDLLLAKRFPKIWVSHTGRTRPPAVALAPSQTGMSAHHAEQPAALPRDEPGLVPQAKAVHQERPRGTRESYAWAVGRPSARGTSEAARPTRFSYRRAGPRRSRRSKAPRRCRSPDDPSRHRASHVVGVRASHRSDNLAFVCEQKNRELSRVKSERGIQRRRRRRLGAISKVKQGNTMVRWLLIEAVYPAVREDLALRQDYQRLRFRRGHAVAKVAIARKLAVRMYWMLRSGAAVRTAGSGRQGSPGATHWWTQVHRWTDWAPCSRERSRRLKKESWSELSDRIDGWWNQNPPLDSRSEPWSNEGKRKDPYR